MTKVEKIWSIGLTTFKIFAKKALSGTIEKKSENSKQSKPFKCKHGKATLVFYSFLVIITNSNQSLTIAQEWAIQGFGQVDTIPIKAVLQFSVRYDTDTILETNCQPDTILENNFQPDMIPIQYLRPISYPIWYRYDNWDQFSTRYDTDTIIGTNWLLNDYWKFHMSIGLINLSLMSILVSILPETIQT